MKRVLLILVFLMMGKASAVTYPTVDMTNFPSGSYNGGEATSLNYRYFIPKNYDENDTNTRYPLVLFLHGNDEKGDDNSKQLSSSNGSMIFISSANPDNQTDHPCFWVAPQVGSGFGDWDSSYIPEQVQGMLDQLIASYHIDPDRIYITGLSMGGAGVIDQISAYPGRYAAANPNAGWFNGDATAYADMPLWAFHSADDPRISVNGSDQIVSQMRAKGGRPIYTRYDTGGHSAWTRAYDPATPLVPWMMSQLRGQALNIDVGPYVQVTSPTDTGKVSTSAPDLVLAGDAHADTTAISYRNSQYYNGPHPTITGLTNWSVTATPLRNDRLNEIYIEAETIAYGALGNGKTTCNDYITISSKHYDIWAEENGLTLTYNSEYEDDPDSDSVSNLLEYAFGLDPMTPSVDRLAWDGEASLSRGFPLFSLTEEGEAQYIYARRVNYSSEGLTYVLQYSSDLAAWTNSLVDPITLYTDGEIEIVEVKDPLIQGSAIAPLYLRMQVDLED